MPAPWFGSPVPDRLNILSPGHVAGNYTHDGAIVSKADNINQWTIYNTVFDSGPNVNTCILGALATAPDGTNTAQKIIENTNNGVHKMSAIAGSNFVGQGAQFRLAVIAKAAERTRIVLQACGNHGGGNFSGVNTVFDLANGMVAVPGTVQGTISAGDPFGLGYRWIPIADKITALGSGWYLCMMDFVPGYVIVEGPGISLNVFIDAGSGTAAQNTSYTGNGTSGVLTWRSNMLPPRAYTLSQQLFFDDFNSLSTFDLANTRLPGFNWYLNNTFPHPGFTIAPTDPATISISAPSVMKISSAPIQISLETIATPPPGVTGNPLSYTSGYSYAPGYIGQVFPLPWLIESNMHWDHQSLTQNFESGFWTVNVEAMFDSASGTGGKFPNAPNIEIDFNTTFPGGTGPLYRAALNMFDLSDQNGVTLEELTVQCTPDGYLPNWSPGMRYGAGNNVSFNGVLYQATAFSGPPSDPAAQPDISPTKWTVISQPAVYFPMNLDTFHIWSTIWLPYVSANDRGIMINFVNGVFCALITYGPDTLQAGVPITPYGQMADNQHFPIFIAGGNTYAVFYDYIALYGPPQGALSDLNIHDSSATLRQTQALDQGAAGTGPWDGSRVLLDGVAGTLLGKSTLDGQAFDSTAAGTISTKSLTTPTSAASSVASSASNVTILANNPLRVWANIYNESTQNLYLYLPTYGDGTVASTSTFTVLIAPGANYELPVTHTGPVLGLWASANGFARITEITSPTSYVGPGDLGIPFTAYWGSRAFSVATIGNRCLQLRRASDNTTQDFVTLANGSIDMASIKTFGAGTTLKVSALYDQTGNGYDQTRFNDHFGTTAEVPFTLNVINGVGTYDNTTGVNAMYGATITQAIADTNNHSFLGVYNVQTAGNFQSVVPLANDEIGMIASFDNNPSDICAKNEGTGRGDDTALTPATDGAWHAAVAVINQTTAQNSGIANSFINADNATTVTHDLAGNPHSTPATRADLTLVPLMCLGGDEGTLPASTNPLKGFIAEVGWFANPPPANPWTQSQARQLIANCKAFWGI